MTLFTLQRSSVYPKYSETTAWEWVFVCAIFGFIFISISFVLRKREKERLWDAFNAFMHMVNLLPVDVLWLFVFGDFFFVLFSTVWMPCAMWLMCDIIFLFVSVCLSAWLRVCVRLILLTYKISTIAPESTWRRNRSTKNSHNWSKPSITFYVRFLYSQLVFVYVRQSLFLRP